MALIMTYFHKKQEYRLNRDEAPVLNLNETEKNELFVIIETNENEKNVVERIENSTWKISEEANYRDCYRIFLIEKKL